MAAPDLYLIIFVVMFAGVMVLLFSGRPSKPPTIRYAHLIEDEKPKRKHDEIEPPVEADLTGYTVGDDGELKPPPPPLPYEPPFGLHADSMHMIRMETPPLPYSGYPTQSPYPPSGRSSFPKYYREGGFVYPHGEWPEAEPTFYPPSTSKPRPEPSVERPNPPPRSGVK